MAHFFLIFNIFMHMVKEFVIPGDIFVLVQNFAYG